MKEDHVQIVRPLRVEEPMPSYSTAALLYGCTFPAPEPKEPATRTTKPDPQKPSRSRLNQSKDCIARMLIENRTNREIAEEMNICVNSVINYCNRDPELRELARTRGQNANWNLAAKHDLIFESYRTRILEWLRKGDTFGSIADRIGMSTPSAIQRIKKDRAMMEIVHGNPDRWKRGGKPRGEPKK